MSIDLSFWRYEKGEYLDNDEVYRRGSNGEVIEGLESLPIDDIISALCTEFDGWECTQNGNELIFEGGENGAFEMMTTAQFIRVDCRGMDYENMNRIIDVMHDFACPLYDPSLPQRFDTDIEI